MAMAKKLSKKRAAAVALYDRQKHYTIDEAVEKGRSMKAA
jgi:hypothetical protein